LRKKEKKKLEFKGPEVSQCFEWQENTQIKQQNKFKYFLLIKKLV